MAYLDSIYWDILSACRHQILSIGELPLLPAQVGIRKRPSFQKDHDVLPFACISPESESIIDEQFDTGAGTGGLHMAYPVLVTLITQTKLLLEDLRWQLAMRQSIRRKLHKALLLNADTVFDCNKVDLDPIWDLSGLDTAFDVSLMRFTYHSAEQRQEAP